MNLETLPSPRSVNDYVDVARILADYELCYISRVTSLLGQKEVLGGRAKFGIFGDGKEVAQVVLAHFFAEGDWRSGYYRDQTLMFARQMSNVRQFFAQLYADTDRQAEPSSGGRQMVSHFATRTYSEGGEWLPQVAMCNTAADLSPVAAQMGRAVGLAYASKLYRGLSDLRNTAEYANFTRNGDEVVFATIGDAGTSEGIFWEAVNAAGVLQIPLVTLVWDDNYGISVPTVEQTVKSSISEALAGFMPEGEQRGVEIYQVRGWDYNALYLTFRAAIPKVRATHTPALFHITELTQPQGHSTSGSHERYKSGGRLKHEAEIDCLGMFRRWILDNALINETELEKREHAANAYVQGERDAAWESFRHPLEAQRKEVLEVYTKLGTASNIVAREQERLRGLPQVLHRELAESMHRVLVAGCKAGGEFEELRELYRRHDAERRAVYGSHLHCEVKERATLQVEEVHAEYTDACEEMDGRLIILRCFENLCATDPRFFAIGEDIGRLGGVNLCFQGLQEKYGELRVTDTGIREATILGQGIGAALRGLRPIVDIQYLDYLLYCLQLLSDDLACLHYRTAGAQIAPVIVRTKGHRLEGIWHTGSMLGMVVNAIRGVYLCVPRNMVQAMGMYNTLARGDDPAVLVEVLNAYRVKERLPANYREFTVPLGVPEILRTGDDVTLVTYGACVQVASEACGLLAELGVSVELIDVQCLLPFDVRKVIATSLQKTQAVVFLDEDMPGGASAFMAQQVLERDGGFDLLDVSPTTVTGAPHRGAYGSDGDYYSKPSTAQVCAAVYGVMRNRDPRRFPDYA